MSSILDRAKPISEVTQGSLWVVYGRSSTGKTKTIGTFPKPMLYIQIGDDGSNTIRNVDGIDYISVENIEEFMTLAKELLKNKHYKTIAVDTFSLIVNEWTNEKVLSKGKRMTQQNWGDLKNDTEAAIKAMSKLARKHIVVLSCHESMDSIEGMEDEIAPDGRPSVSKGARTYLEGMANYGIHTIRIQKEITKGNSTKVLVKYAADIGPNPYYWTKLQSDPDIKVPDRITNPSYDKIMKIVSSVE